jgi:outer membrane protein TolC
MNVRRVGLVLGLAVASSIELATFAQEVAKTPPAAPSDDPGSLVPFSGEIPEKPAPTKVLSSWKEAVTMASAEDPDYSAAIFEIDRLQGVRRQSLGGALPSLTASGSVNVALLQTEVPGISPTGDIITQTIPQSPTASLNLVLRQPLLAPRVWWAIGTADEQIEAAELGLSNRQRILVAQVADAIVSEVTAEKIADVNRNQLAASLERLRLQKRRRELGAGTDLDLLRFEQDVVAARVSVVRGDESLNQARERLGLAIGTTERYAVAPDISIDEIQDTLERICSAGDVVDRADLKLLAKQKEIAERALTDADLLYAPTADLSSTLTLSSQEILGTGHATWNVQAVLTIPIWDGGVRYGVRRAAEASVEVVDARLDATQRTVTIEVRQTDRGMRVADDSLKLAQATRDLAKRTVELTQQAFDEGAPGITSFELVDASRVLRETELTLAVRELEYVRAKITALVAARNCTY